MRPRNECGGENVWQHMNTFCKILFDNIDSRYLQDSSGVYFETGSECEFMLPIVEQSEVDRNIDI